MVTLKQFMETINFRITEGSEYSWQCYGNDAYSLDSWSGEQDGQSASIVFDTKTQEVFEVCVFDYSDNRAYRLINPLYTEKHAEEGKSRGVEDTAWDDVKHVDLEVDEDWLDKASAILAGRDYDTRIQMVVEIPDHELLTFMKAAHERDMTFNRFVETALQSAIDKHENEKEIEQIESY